MSIDSSGIGQILDMGPGRHLPRRISDKEQLAKRSLESRRRQRAIAKQQKSLNARERSVEEGGGLEWNESKKKNVHQAYAKRCFYRTYTRSRLAFDLLAVFAIRSIILAMHGESSRIIVMGCMLACLVLPLPLLHSHKYDAREYLFSDPLIQDWPAQTS